MKNPFDYSIRTIPAALVAVLLITPQSRSQVNSAAPQPHSDAGTALPEEARPTQPLFHSGPIPRSEYTARDARLNDVCAAGRHCFAVGERGTVVVSHDGGLTWQEHTIPEDDSLHAVCCLTDTMGYVAGSRFSSDHQQHVGVLWRTRDGGQSWQEIFCRQTMPTTQSRAGALPVPPFAAIRFFDTQNAVAVTTPAHPDDTARVLRTTDGGSSWNVVATAPPRTAWLAAEFSDSATGVLAGLGGQTDALIGDRLIPMSQRNPHDLRRLRDISLRSDDTRGWMCGDGNQLLTSADHGVTWQPPSGKLAPELSGLIDYHTISHHGRQVCAAGTPGSIVLHSKDDGNTWTFRQLSSSVPIHRLRYISDKVVLAVGAFGVIHRSEDGGLTWSTVRNSSLRAATLCLTNSPESLSFRMLAETSGELGFRSVVAQTSARRPLSRPSDMFFSTWLRKAVPLIGCDDFDVDWMFFRDRPMHDRVAQALQQAWQRQTDGRAADLLPLRLARLLRVWRPDVVVLDRADAEDQLAGIWITHLPRARDIAAGSDNLSTLLDKIGLPQWQIARVFVRQDAETRGGVRFVPDQPLLRSATSAGLVEEFARQAALLEDPPAQLPRIDADAHCYRLLSLNSAEPTPPALHSGLNIAPGSDARRPLLAPSAQRKLMEALLQQFRTRNAAAFGQLTRSVTPVDLTAQLQQLGQDLPDRLVLQQLQYLASLYHEQHNLDGEAAVLNQIVQRFPDSVEGARAAFRLFLFYSSEELRLLRRRHSSRRILQTASFSDSDSESGLTGAANSSLSSDGSTNRGRPLGMPARSVPASTSLLPNASAKTSDALDAVWNRKASAMQALAAGRSESVTMRAWLLLREAANARRNDEFGLCQTRLTEAANLSVEQATFARAELQALQGTSVNPLPTIRTARSTKRPWLDSRLADEIWHEAAEVRLHSESQTSGSDQPACMILFAWDNEFLYIGGRIERPAAGTNTPVDRTAPRDHDADHGLRDRIILRFDTDRDYQTWYQLTIDDAGQTSDSCWQSSRWNPKWYVADSSEPGVWRFEAAIPHQELTEGGIRPGHLWAIQAKRLLPGQLEQTLTNDQTDQSLKSSTGTGLLRFMR